MAAAIDYEKTLDNITDEMMNELWETTPNFRFDEDKVLSNTSDNASHPISSQLNQTPVENNHFVYPAHSEPMLNYQTQPEVYYQTQPEFYYQTQPEVYYQTQPEVYYQIQPQSQLQHPQNYQINPQPRTNYGTDYYHTQAQPQQPQMSSSFVSTEVQTEGSLAPIEQKRKNKKRKNMVKGSIVQKYSAGKTWHTCPVCKNGKIEVVMPTDMAAIEEHKKDGKLGIKNHFLSRRKRKEVIDMIEAGNSNIEVAKHTNVSGKTVDRYRKNGCNLKKGDLYESEVANRLCEENMVYLKLPKEVVKFVVKSISTYIKLTSLSLFLSFRIEPEKTTRSIGKVNISIDSL